MNAVKHIDIDKLFWLYSQGKSQEAIGKIFGVSQWLISNRMRTHNIVRRPKTNKLSEYRTKWTVDESVLDKITPKLLHREALL